MVSPNLPQYPQKPALLGGAANQDCGILKDIEWKLPPNLILIPYKITKTETIKSPSIVPGEALEEYSKN